MKAIAPTAKKACRVDAAMGAWS